ncbi:TetR/AcrR family transcriptional regulator [Bacillus sp. FSL K6-3431]|uniref:TetR/AcrR family transcriptional regulator n=1 Tax=Bacillus sp. FSL K6-3431 TaxID=2921500 RepID=UPI0030F68284
MENRKSQIIDLTLKIIREKGYLSFSYDDISKQLGITKASIHYHFVKKEDLGSAICERIKEGLEKSFLEVSRTSIKIEDKPLEFILRRAGSIGRDEVCPLTSLQADFNFLPVPMQKSVQQLSQMEIDFLVKLVEEMKSNGMLQSAQDPQALAILIISSTKGALQYRRALGNDAFSLVFDQLKHLLK